MSVVSPPEPLEQHEIEALIREARARQRRRRLGLVALVAVLAGAAIGIDSIVTGTRPMTSAAAGSGGAVEKSGTACGVRVAWTKILDRHGRVLYREPIRRTMGHQLRCSGSSLWVVFYNGVGMSQQAYFGVHSGDGGRTWRPVFSESYFTLKAPHRLDSYMGPWTLTRRAAYFVGLCPACGRQPTVSLWVTKDGGLRFRRYDLPALDGYWPRAIRVAGDRVTIRSGRAGRWKAVTLRTA